MHTRRKGGGGRREELRSNSISQEKLRRVGGRGRAQKAVVNEEEAIQPKVSTQKPHRFRPRSSSLQSRRRSSSREDTSKEEEETSTEQAVRAEVVPRRRLVVTVDTTVSSCSC